MGHFRDESFEAIDWTGTDNQRKTRKQNTTYTRNTKGTQEKNPALPTKQTKPQFGMAFCGIWPGNGAGPVLTIPEPAQSS